MWREIDFCCFFWRRPVWKGGDVYYYHYINVLHLHNDWVQWQTKSSLGPWEDKQHKRETPWPPHVTALQERCCCHHHPAPCPRQQRSAGDKELPLWHEAWLWQPTGSHRRFHVHKIPQIWSQHFSCHPNNIIFNYYFLFIWGVSKCLFGCFLTTVLFYISAGLFKVEIPYLWQYGFFFFPNKEHRLTLCIQLQLM